MKFPVSPTHRLQVIVIIEEKGFMGRPGAFFPTQERPDVLAIDDAVCRQLRAGQLREGRENVHRACELYTHHRAGRAANACGGVKISKADAVGRV